MQPTIVLSRLALPARRTSLVAAVCLVAALWSEPASALDPHVRLTQYATLSFQIEQGLPQNSVQALVHSRDGYLWLGTQAGLVRFDGVHLAIFDRASQPEFKSEFIRALAEDSDGRLWIATDAGLLSYKGKFLPFSDAGRLPSQQIRSLLVATDGTLWVGTTAGVSRVKDGRLLQPVVVPGTEKTAPVRMVQARDGSIWLCATSGLQHIVGTGVQSYTIADGLPDDTVYAVQEDHEGAIWIGTSRGLARLRGGVIERVPMPVDDSVHAVFEDREGAIWLGLERRGIVRFHDGKSEVYGAAEGLAGNYVLDFIEDKPGNVWVALFDSGLTCLRQTPFSGFGTREGLPSNDVQTILQTRSGEIWLGTNTSGVTRLADGSATSYSVKQGLPDEVVMTLAEDRDGSVWIGTRRGLCRFSRGKVVPVPDPDRLLYGGLRSLLQSPDGTLWIGTSEAGLVVLENGKLRAFPTRGDPMPRGIKALLMSRSGVLWLATDVGLTSIRNSHAKTYTTTDGLGENNVLSLYEDRDGVLWVGTFGGGVSRFKDGIATISQQHGLYDNSAFAILEDDNGYLWMSSNRGIFKALKSDMNLVAAGRATHVQSVGYAVADGLRGTEGNGGTQPAAWKMTDGRLWFAGIRGAAIVDPRTVAVPTPTVLIERMVYGMMNGRTEVSLADERIDLDAGTGDVSIDYTAPDYHAPQSLEFRYRLDPFDPDWENPLGRRSAFYTRVPPGEYVFRVEARNKGGSWSPVQATLKFRIRPHYYQANWFYALCTLMVALAGTSAYGMRVRGMKAREKTLARLVDARTSELLAEVEARRQAQTRLEREIAEREQVQAELARAMGRAEAANQAKGMFLANMSHEIRTPMNGILGMTELLLDSPMTSDQREHLGMVRSSATSLLSVINDVLDFSKIDAGRMELEAIPFNVREFVRETVPPFTALAADRGLELRWSVDSAVPTSVVGDPGRLRQVIVNLMGNAIKFTESGSVALTIDKVRIDAHAAMLSVQVHDTGIGIPAEKLTAVFEPFTQADGSMTRRYGGTGLGLTITAQLVRLMGGEINVQSEVGRGTTFAFTVKMGLPPAETSASPEAAPPNRSAAQPAMQKLRVLVVEDNLVNQRLIGRLLQKWGHDVTIVSSGEQAVDATAASAFDLVLMDVQMPGMDGFEATQAIRSREAATGAPHLLIIAITAHAMKGDRERCLEAGMDGYVSKPVEAAELQRTIAAMVPCVAT